MKALGRFDSVDLCNGRMVQRRERLGFAFEACDALDVVGEHVGKNFDGDVAAEARITGPVHLAHSTRADGRDHFVRPKARSCGQAHQERTSYAVARQRRL